MASYQFPISIQIVPAFTKYFYSHWLVPDTGVSYNGSNIVTVYTPSPLSTEDQAALEAVIAAYVDPDYFLILDHTESFSGISNHCNSTTLVPVQSFIFPKYEDGDLVLDAIKTVMSVSVEDVSVLSEADPNVTVTWSAYDNTRNIALCSETMDLSSTVSAWVAAAEGGATGPLYHYQCMMLCGLVSKTTNFDTIWTFSLSISNPALTVQMNGLQTLYYNKLT